MPIESNNEEVRIVEYEPVSEDAISKWCIF